MPHRPLTVRINGRLRMARQRALGHWATAALLRRRFRRHTGTDLDVEHPVTMTQKVFARMVLMARSRDRSVQGLVDKLAMREVVARVVGEEHLVPLLWQGSDPAAIPFATLPSPAFLKPTHMTGEYLRLGADTDPAQVLRRARGWLRQDIYWPGREYQYHGLPRRLVVEACLDDGAPHGPVDYSFWCFHGEPRLVQLRNGIRGARTFVDLDFAPITVYAPGAAPVAVSRPGTWQQMIDVAAALSEPFEFVRVDLYGVGSSVFVGELTFTPAGGRLDFASPRHDADMGAAWSFDPRAPVLDADAFPAFRTPPLRGSTR